MTIITEKLRMSLALPLKDLKELIQDQEILLVIEIVLELSLNL